MDGEESSTTAQREPPRTGRERESRNKTHTYSSGRWYTSWQSKAGTAQHSPQSTDTRGPATDTVSAEHHKSTYHTAALKSRSPLLRPLTTTTCHLPSLPYSLLLSCCHLTDLSTSTLAGVGATARSPGALVLSAPLSAVLQWSGCGRCRSVCVHAASACWCGLQCVWCAVSIAATACTTAVGASTTGCRCGRPTDLSIATTRASRISLADRSLLGNDHTKCALLDLSAVESQRLVQLVVGHCHEAVASAASITQSSLPLDDVHLRALLPRWPPPPAA